MSNRAAPWIIVPLAFAATASQPQDSSPGPSWTADFAAPDMNGAVAALASFDDGHGADLYAAGQFTFAGGTFADHIARWNGARWSPLGSGLNHHATALVVHDDGHGPALFVGGSFWEAGGRVARAVARWDGASWSSPGGGLGGIGGPPQVDALAVFDDGTGPALYAGGAFAWIGAQPARSLARWDGTAWSPIGTPFGGQVHVRCLQVFDDGHGPALYVGGSFQAIGGVAANNVARWDGTTWSPLGSGSESSIGSMAVYDDGAGPKLYMTGTFGSSGSSQHTLAQWDGSNLSTFGPDTYAFHAHSLGVSVDGHGRRLLVGYWGQAWAGGVATWDGLRWSTLPGRMYGGMTTFAVHDVGSGPALYAGGGFTQIGSELAGRIARWNGSTWSPLRASTGAGGGWIVSQTVFDDGTGPELYVGGWFHDRIGAARARHVARWDGSRWSAVGEGPPGHVNALAVHDDGTGRALYAGGQSIERWNGSVWSSLGTGLHGNPSAVYALAVFDDGTGPALYAGGEFTIGGMPSAVHQVARWDGSAWTPIATPPTGPGSPVLSLAVFDDGTGPGLYAGGYFHWIGSQSAFGVARWDGSTWSTVGGGVGGSIEAMTTFDDGAGPALYVGGYLYWAGGASVDGVARWDGSTWSAVGASSGDPSKRVHALGVHDDGSGPALYAGGAILDPSSLAPRGVARLEGTRWHFLGTGVDGDVYSLLGIDSGSGRDLYAAGLFTVAGRHASQGIARWRR